MRVRVRRRRAVPHTGAPERKCHVIDGATRPSEYRRIQGDALEECPHGKPGGVNCVDPDCDLLLSIARNARP